MISKIIIHHRINSHYLKNDMKFNNTEVAKMT